MRDPALFRRNAAAVGLVAAALLMVVSAATAPEFVSDKTEQLALVEAAGSTALVSALAFVLAQLPFVAAVLAIGHLLRGGAPLLGSLGATLGVVGAFGHSVHGGVSLLSVAMAEDVAARETYAQLLADSESGPLVPFMAMGLLGTVIGLVLLAVGLWRARVSPRWAGPALGAFILVEFVGSAVTEWATYLSVAIYTLVLVALAVTVRRTPVDAWTSGADAAAAVEQPAARA